MRKCAKFFPIYKGAVSHIWLCTWSLWISLYLRKILFYFLSVWAQRERETAICITFLIISSDKRPSRAAQPSPAQPSPAKPSPSCRINLREWTHQVKGRQICVWKKWMRSIPVVDEIYPSGWGLSELWMKCIRVVGWDLSERVHEVYPSYGWDISDPSGWMRSIRVVGWDLSEWGIKSILVGDKIYPRCGWDVS